jgi:hypothetical protein
VWNASICQTWPAPLVAFRRMTWQNPATAAEQARFGDFVERHNTERPLEALAPPAVSGVGGMAYDQG